mmetsp:Transcript_26184/g.63820  ORF Transcript_26184/g.63820 Transcript_26184/m.63820 type:complete len:199 (+) Transcript_26184:177-773(+)|eukprot:CAMPEP_0113638284 /NCGR_PEP_ID=MMETSP0017_2-20120614/20050_1 /TAXON_ID=2856 /ORGANISM="Cylindrotheca closterium" /LENGTH=198 /DNA_ID=CAMNT_0000549373 /DNA_START=182 /DNA_END=778 /DNA_ORIENTATION=+ /assembly_acc=CAM_ASM_000147
MRQDYLLDTVNSSHTSLHVLDWSLQNSKTEPPFQLKSNQQWELLGEIDVAAQSPKPQHTSTTTTTPVQRPRRHRCISDDTESSSHDSPESESSSFDLKPKSLNSYFESSSSDGSFGELPMLGLEPSFEETSRPTKRSRDCLESSELCCDYAAEEAQLCSSDDRQQRTTTPSRKRRRVAGRNNALCAADYNDIFSKIGC